MSVLPCKGYLVLSETGEWGSKISKLGNETPVEVDKTQEGLDFLSRCGYGPLGNCL